MFELIKDFNENGIALKAGKYSKEDLIKLYGGQDKFNYCFTCTSLKNALKESKEGIIEEVKEITIETPAVEEVKEFAPITISYIAKEDIKKGKKVIFKKDQKITLEELEANFTLEEVADKLIETKGV
jgi:hypothetical protein